MFNLLNERSADATVTGRVTEDSQGHALVLKYLNKTKSSHRHRLKEFLTKLISNKFGRVCQSSIKRVLSVAFTSDCNREPRGSCPGSPPLSALLQVIASTGWSRERLFVILSHNVLLLRSFLYLVCLLVLRTFTYTWRSSPS